jgi:hypothetical protein
MKVIRGALPGSDACNSIAMQLGFSLVSPITPEEGEDLFSEVAEELFRESDPYTSTSLHGEPLGDLALKLVEEMYSLTDDFQ